MVTRKYTDKDILVALAEGTSRKEIAKNYGHTDIRPIDNYMKSQGYSWHKDANMYRKVRTTVAGFASPIETKEKVIDIMTCFTAGMEAKDVAKQFGFPSNRELATYMKQQGFEWSNDKRNYTPKEIETAIQPTENIKTNYLVKTESLTITEIEFLQELLTFRQILIPMLQVKASLEPSFPVYSIEGITHSKSVQITNSLDELIRTFCREKKISQKQIFEIALIEFLQKYGYENELSTVLQFTKGTFSVAYTG